jgi:diguanylate cyclase (GGDEF)-like protein
MMLEVYPRLLLVEDDPNDAAMVLAALVEGGVSAETHRIANATALVSCLGDATWDLVITDCRLHGFGGREVLALVQEFAGDLPVIVVSASVGEEVAASMMRQGARDFVSKTNLSRLAPAVQRELREARARAARRLAEQRAWRLAFRDPVTELPNRNGLIDHIARALATASAPTAVVSLELRELSEIRNTVGPRQLDVFLRSAAFRFAGVARHPATLGHVESGTFAVCLPGATSEGAVRVAEGMLRALDLPLHDGSVRVRLCASAGVAVHPEHGGTADILLRRAAVAAELARREGRGIGIYDRHADGFHQARLDLVTDLWGAAERGELRLEYQPSVTPHNGRMVRAEALLRWQRPRVGSVAPPDFIPLAERSGSIRDLTPWVLNEAIHHCVAWRRYGLDAGVAVNLSAMGIHVPGLAGRIRDLLAEAGLPPEQLTVELTEGGLARNPEGAANTLRDLRELGVRAAIDGYGAGTSSLAYLRDLPVSALKIDRSFLREGLGDRRDVSIVRSTVMLAHQLDLSVVAQGVEDAQTYAVLGGLGCDEVQGFHLARPMSPAEMLRWYEGRSGGKKS